MAMFLCNLPNHCGSKKLLSAPGSSAFSIYFFFFYLKDKSERNLCSFSPFFADQNIYGSHCGEKKKSLLTWIPQVLWSSSCKSVDPQCRQSSQLPISTDIYWRVWVLHSLCSRLQPFWALSGSFLLENRLACWKSCLHILICELLATIVQLYKLNSIITFCICYCQLSLWHHLRIQMEDMHPYQASSMKHHWPQFHLMKKSTLYFMITLHRWQLKIHYLLCKKCRYLNKRS